MCDLELIKYYLAKFKTLNCAHIHGRKILAKPFLVLSIIEVIGDGKWKENKFEWEANGFDVLLEAYINQHYRFQPNNYLTPLFKPFFHLSNDGFWHLTFDHGNRPRTVTSNKSLRDQHVCAHLDSTLWDLLQDANVREEFREQIIDFFIRKKTN